MPFIFLAATFAIYFSPLAKVEIPHFLLIHTFLELLSVAMSLTVFVIYLAIRNKSLTTQGLVLSFAFLTIALADVFHIVAYRGMPNFFKLSLSGVSIYFWFISRFFQTAAFFIVATLSTRMISPRYFWPSSILSLISSAVLLGSIVKYADFFPTVYTGNGLSNFKILFELTCSAISVCSAYFFLNRNDDVSMNIDNQRMAASSLYFAVMGVGFTLYGTFHDFMSLWGHVLKLLSYAYVYQSLIFSKLIAPYKKLDVIKHELDLKIENIKLLEEELERSRKIASLGAEVRGMSHDLNNVLMIINNAASSILRIDGVKENDVIVRKIEQIRKATLKSQDFLKSLLTFSKNISTPKQEICLADCVYDFKKLITPLLPQNVSLTISSEDKLCVVLKKIDLEQLLFNLVLNARDALEDRNGVISVRAYRTVLNERLDFLHYQIPEGEYVCLSIEDNGAGIAPEHMSKIFEPFFTTKADGKGTGIGLSTVVSIVQKNNGYLKVDSLPGAGSKFTLYFLNSSVAMEENGMKVA